MDNQINRRNFMKAVAVAGAGLAVGDDLLAAIQPAGLSAPTRPPQAGAPTQKVRIGYVGVGLQGISHVENLLKVEGAEIVAVCDIIGSKVQRAQDMVEKAGFKRPDGYSKNEVDWQRLCGRKDIDLVYTATPWQWHVPVCLAAMNSGKHVATEVPAAITMDECWELVETSEKRGKYCIMMENCNYDKVEMMILNMVKKGLFGEMVHAECGYLHDLREEKHDMEGEGVWRRDFSMHHNGDLYPTHGLGPVMQCLDINRGNYFDSLVSFGSKTRGLHEYAVARFGPDSPQAREKFVLSDVVTTLIRTMNGETIVVTHDTSLPRPYSRNIVLQGTRGIVRKYPEPKIYIEGVSKTDNQWEPINDYLKKYQHPIWEELETASMGAGHGGMDYIEDYRLVNALLKGVEPDMDVYDAVVMSAVRVLSEQSIAKGGKTMKFPDFTRGMWKKPRELMVMKNALFVFLLLSCFFPLPAISQRSVAGHARSVITPMLMKQTISYLASDSMKGRATPSAELDAAAEYIAGTFKSYGLQPLNGSWFQNIAYCNFDLGRDNFLSIVKRLETKNYTLRDDFIPYAHSGSRAAEGDIVFAGYGITAPEYNYDDYKELEVKGKIVVVLRQEPGQTDSTQKLFEGDELTHYSGLIEKQENAQRHGAAALLIMSGPLQYTSLKPTGYPWPSLVKNLPKDLLPVDFCGKTAINIPMVHVGESIISELFGDADSLKRIQRRIEKNMQPGSYRIRGKTLAMNIVLTATPIGGRNVVAWLEGSDPALKDEVIIIGGHYDHIGCAKEHLPGDDYIYNGADDNASGTSGVLAIAKAFSSMAGTPKRSVLFMAFAGEERGLLGSATYVQKPLWPLANTVAMLNLDMIGRNSPDSLEIVGAGLNPGLAKIVRKQNKETGFYLIERKSKLLDGGSDHASFFRKGVPAIFFFTGLHPDYHEVSDSPDRIDADKAARVARLAFLTAWAAANESRRYRIKQPSGDE